MWRKPFFLAIRRRELIYWLALPVFVAVFALGALVVRPAGIDVADISGPRRVAIDAGHGGPDPGAIGVAGTQEKDVSLAIALRLDEELRELGIDTVMTRTGDYDLVRGDPVPHRQREDLIRRAAVVNDSGAHLLVSLHANSFPGGNWSGAQTFHLEGDEAGRRLALRIQNALVTELAPNTRRAAPAELRILRDVHAPAVVVEVGFLSNPDEERLLVQPDYQRRVARAIVAGILEHFAAEEKRPPLMEAPVRN